jgi:wyosine [tRNA(Phe)-imidazoG37] synthetase (radical SAM superfamily)
MPTDLRSYIKQSINLRNASFDDILAKPTMCAIPFVQCNVNTDGSFKVCCIANGPEAYIRDADDNNIYIHDASFNDIWNSTTMRDIRKKMLNDELPNECRVCNQVNAKNRSVGQELMIEWEAILGDNFVQRIKQARENNYNIKEPPVYFDLRLGNTCDLACVMCGPVNSSKWGELAKSITIKTGMELGIHITKWWNSKKIWKELKESLVHAKEIKFAGGEPLLLKQHKDILKFLKENNPNCIIRYTTNLNNITQEYIDLWQELPNCNFSISIDGINDRLEYLRWPIKWDKMLNNLLMLNQLKPQRMITLIYTLTLFNILYINNDIKHLSNIDIQWTRIEINPVYVPRFLQANLLPASAKKNIQLDNPTHMKKVSYVLSETPDDKTLIKDFFTYVNDIDKARGTNFRKTFPELAGVLDNGL